MRNRLQLTILASILSLNWAILISFADDSPHKPLPKPQTQRTQKTKPVVLVAKNILQPGHAFVDCSNCPEMVVIPAGEFDMGSPTNEAGHSKNEDPVHHVKVVSFALGKTEITKGQFATFVKETGYDTGDKCVTFEGQLLSLREGRNWRNPSFQQEDNHPAVCLNWNDANAYVQWLTKKTGKTYRLPTEAEWEYAARAGTSSPRYWDEFQSQPCEYANVADQTLKADAPKDWLFFNCTDGYKNTAPVGSFKPNSFGLYDMIGNVWEWVEDCYHPNYDGAPLDGSAWKSGDCSKMVLRGSSILDEPRVTRSASRQDIGVSVRSFRLGFRVSRNLDSTEIPSVSPVTTSSNTKPVSEIRNRPSSNLATEASTKVDENAYSEVITTLEPAAQAFRDGVAGTSDCFGCPDLAGIPAGSFNMGSLNNEIGRWPTEGPVHRVNVPAFAIGQAEITRAQFASFVAESGYSTEDNCLSLENGQWQKTGFLNWKNPGFSQDDNHPVVCVNRNDAQAYARWLSQKTGKNYRLPTEAEWEYAARAGTITARYWGENPDEACRYANVGDQSVLGLPGTASFKIHNCDDHALYTAPAGSYQPNAFGLYDMLGNVFEIIQDCSNSDYTNAPQNGSASFTGNCDYYEVRGGSWVGGPRNVRTAGRGAHLLPERATEIGFRITRTETAASADDAVLILSIGLVEAIREFKSACEEKLPQFKSQNDAAFQASIYSVETTDIIAKVRDSRIKNDITDKITNFRRKLRQNLLNPKPDNKFHSMCGAFPEALKRSMQKK